MFVLFFFLGLFVYALIRVLLTGFFTVRPAERAVLTSFGKAQRMPRASLPEGDPEDGDRYEYPAIRVIRPGGPYVKWPWQKV